MSFTRPRETQDSKFFTVEFLAPDADAKAFFIEMSGSKLLIRGKYLSDPGSKYFSLYNRGSLKIDTAYDIPTLVTDDKRYIDIWYEDGVLTCRFRKSDEKPEGRFRIYLS